MNYPLQHACFDFFAKGTIRARSFASRLAKVQVNHTHAVNLAMFNLLDSHDTERFLTSCGGDVRKLALAAAFQLTYEGSPMIYYGDEVGMVGLTDPDCRRGMLWDEAEQDRELFRWYQRLIALRRSSLCCAPDGPAPSGRTASPTCTGLCASRAGSRSWSFEQLPEEQRVDLRQISWPGRNPGSCGSAR